MSEQEFIQKISSCAIKDMEASGILASITIAQGILESGYGSTELAVNANNFFGMKCSLSGNTWESVWDQVSKYTKKTKEQDKNGNEYEVTADFRKYPDMETSVKDHSCYLNGAMNGNKLRYEGLRGEKDYRKAVQIIKNGGYATDVKYVDKVCNIIESFNLTQYDKEVNIMEYTNSSLVEYTQLSPNHSGQRTHTIDRITPHCVVGQCSIETLGGIFAPSSRQASCQYGIGVDGRVGMYCEEKNRSWCSSSNSNDQRAVTIECASDTTHPYAMNDKVYATLINLCVDICKRNGKTKLLWFGDKDKTLSYEPKDDEMIITVHRWFANKSCPGDWLYNRLGDLAAQVTKKLSGDTKEAPSIDVLYRVQVGAYSVKANADAQLAKVKAAGFDTYMVNVNGMYKIQVGAYSVKTNADNMLAKVKAAGFDAFITTNGGQAVATTTEPVKNTIRVGSTVKLKKGAKTYTGGSLASFVYERNHEVKSISNDRVVITYGGTVVAAVKMSDLTLVN